MPVHQPPSIISRSAGPRVRMPRPAVPPVRRFRSTARCVRVLAVVFASLLLAACQSHPWFPRPAPVPVPPPAALPAPVKFAGPIPDDVLASNRPPNPMPQPGQMPAGSYMRQIQDSGKLIAGLRSDIVLFSFIDPLTGIRDGFDVAMVRAVARAIFGSDDASHLDMRTVLSADRIPGLQAGRFQIVAAVMTITAERKQQIDFSELYFRAAQRVLVSGENPARGIDDMDGQRVCAAEGSTSIPQILGANPNVKIVVRDSESDCAADLQQGLVDGVSTDDAILAGLGTQAGYAKVIGEPFSDEPYGLGIQQDHPEFVAFVNGVLSQMKANGEWKADYERYLAAGLTPGQPTPDPPRSIYQTP
jgi:polar amino acid transport system substrate-binding protein